MQKLKNICSSTIVEAIVSKEVVDLVQRYTHSFVTKGKKVVKKRGKGHLTSVSNT